LILVQSRKLKAFGLLLLFMVPSCGFLVYINLPGLVNALPGQVRGRLPEDVLSYVTTPLPTALPAPEIVPARPTLTPIAAIILSAATAEDPEPERVDLGEPIAGKTPFSASETDPVNTESPSPTIVPTPTFLPLPSAINIIGPEIVPQQFNNCGPANLSIVLNYFGHDTDQQEIGQALKPNYDDRNVSPHELAAFVNERTLLRGHVYRGGDLTLLKRLLAAGIPVIIEKGLQLNKQQGWMGHYLTLVGYRDASEQFYTLDTYLGPWDGSGRLDDYETIEQLWAQFNNTFIVVFPSEEEEVVSSMLGPEMAEPILMWQNAALSAQRSIESEEESAFSWFNLGASLTHLGELSGDTSYYENAAQAFDQARTIGLPWRMLWYQFEPYVAYMAAGRIQDVRDLSEAILSDSGGRDVEETHLYQGYALLATGDIAGAERSYRRALNLNPNYEAARLALAALP
jgi:tetratricopeptide (TPR) repeat protein